MKPGSLEAPEETKDEEEIIHPPYLLILRNDKQILLAHESLLSTSTCMSENRD